MGWRILKRSFVWLTPLLITLCLSCYAQPTLQHAPGNATTNATANAKPGIASKTVGWQENSSRRGTMDILQSSLFTILICTWTVQHLNIPAPSDSKRRRLFRKIRWMLITILVPEFLLVHAIMERKMAFESLQHLKGFNSVLVNDRSRWNALKEKVRKLCKRLHSHSSSDPVGNSPMPPPSEFQVPVMWNQTHAYYANMGGFRLAVTSELTERSTVPLNTEQLVRAHQDGFINKLPDLSVDDILDKSKGDFFTKSLAIVQILWLIITLFIRVKKGLAITQLEVLTVAFALCSTLTYLFWWDKPQDVNTATLIGSGDRKLPDEDYGMKSGQADRLLRTLLDPLKNFQKDSLPRRIPNDNFRQSGGSQEFVSYYLVISAILFNLVHTFAFPFPFPTSAERYTWMVATLLSLILPPLSVYSGILRLRAIREPAYSLPLSPWPSTIEEAKQFLAAFASTYQGNMFSKLVEKRIKAANSQGGPSSAYHELFEVVPDDSLHSRIFLRERVLQKTTKGLYFYLPAKTTPLLEWQIRHFWSEMDRGYFQPWTQPPNTEPFDLPQIICDMPVPALTKTVEFSLQCNIVHHNNLKRNFYKGLKYKVLRVTRDGSLLLYPIARLSIIVIAFTSLRALPDSAYNATWTTYIPAIQ